MPGQGQPPAGTTACAPATPVAGETDVYWVTSVDDANNTIAVGCVQQVASVSGPHDDVSR